MSFIEKIFYYGGLAILILAVVALFGFALIPHVSAAHINNPNDPLHIENGGCVPINSTVDISSLGWGVPYITYYGLYEDSFDPGNTTPKAKISLPYSAKALKTYYIDPVIFGDKPGFWYQNYEEYKPTGAANYRMFFVDETCNMPVIVNATEFINITPINTTYPKPMPYLPEKPVGALLLARGDSVAFTAPNAVESNVWVFGRDKDFSIYDYKTNQNVVFFDAEQFMNFEVGDYDAVIIQKGNNSILEEGYDPSYQPEKYTTMRWPAITSPFRNVSPINIHGIQPRLVEDLLINRVNESFDDKYTIWPISFQDPEIQIKRVDALRSLNNNTWYNIRGYTNVINGTILTITIDADNLNEETRDIRQWETTVQGLDSDAWRQFNALIPVDYDNIFPGYHYITITSKTGATQTVPIYIYRELPKHYVPPEYTEYFGTSPFVTPKIIEKEVPVPGPTRIVEVIVTSSDQEITDKAQSLIGGYAIIAAIILALLYGLYRAARYALSVWKRARI